MKTKQIVPDPVARVEAKMRREASHSSGGWFGDEKKEEGKLQAPSKSAYTQISQLFFWPVTQICIPATHIQCRLGY